MLLAKLKKSDTLSTYAHLIDLYLSDHNDLETYMNELIGQYYQWTSDQITIYQVDRKYIDIISFLAINHKPAMDAHNAQNFSKENWRQVKTYLLEESY